MFTDSDLRDAADRDLTELFGRVPNVTTGAANGQIIVRGIPRGGFGGCCSTVFYMIDGTLYSAVSDRTTVPLWDPAQVEVLRNNEIALLVALGRHALSERWQLDATLSYQDVEDYGEISLNAAPANTSTGVLGQHIRKTGLETRARYTGDRWELVLAALGQRIRADNYRDFNFAVSLPGLGTAPVRRRFRLLHSERLLVSGLALVSWNPHARWTVDAGLRLQSIDEEGRSSSTFERTGSTGNPAADAVIDGILAAAPPTGEARSASAFEPLPVAALSDAVTVGGKVERATRPGGSSINAARARVVPYGAELAWSYELFLRSAWLDGTLTVDGNVFYTQFEDQQVNACFSGQPFDCHEVNAQSSEIVGLELQADWAVSPSLTLRAGMGLLETEFERFQAGLLDWSGNEFPQAPEQSYVVGGSFDRAGGCTRTWTTCWTRSSWTRSSSIRWVGHSSPFRGRRAR